MKILKDYASVFLFVGLIFVALFSYRSRQPAYKNIPEPKQNPFLLPCENGGETGRVSYSGKVILNKNFLDPKLPKDEIALDAVKKHMRYIESFLNNDQALTATTRFFVASDPPIIKIREIKDTHYNISMNVDKVLEYEAIPYVEKAVAKGFTKADDDALEISYDAEIAVAFCGELRSQQSIIDLYLPHDPYLAFWYVEKGERRPIRFGSERSVVNPCSDLEAGHLKVPSFYWYVWEPRAERKDDDEKKYACEKLLKPDVHYTIYKATLTAPPMGKAFTFGDGLASLKSPITGTAIFGPLLQYEVKIDLQDVYDRLTGGKKGLLQNSTDYIEHMKTTKVPFDPGLMGFLSFLTNIPQIAEIEKVNLVKEKEHLIFHLDGKFKISQKKLSLDAYFGSTDVGTKKAEHWPILYKSLSEKDFIFYLGHAGMGLNMSIKEMMKDLKVTPAEMNKALAKKKYQMLAILSCRAYSYFGADLKSLKTKAAPGDHLDLLTMANSNYRPFLYLGLFRYLDRLLNNEHPGLYQVLESYISSDDMLVVEGVNRG